MGTKNLSQFRALFGRSATPLGEARIFDPLLGEAR
jgi:hypothetical protein